MKEGGLSAWAENGLETRTALFLSEPAALLSGPLLRISGIKKRIRRFWQPDEKGRFVIPLLSGHLGGANELAERLAAGLAKSGIPAQAVLTTATDVNRRFAVDVFAKEHGLVLDQMKLAKEISAGGPGRGAGGTVFRLPISRDRSRRAL